VPPTVALTADTFGKPNAAIVFGWVFAAHQVGAATAASAAGAIRTWTGDYQLAFIGAGILCLAAAGMSLMVGRTPRPGSAPIPPLLPLNPLPPLSSSRR